MIVVYRTWLEDPSGEIAVYVGIHKEESSDKYVPLWSPENPSGYIGCSMAIEESKRNGSQAVSENLKEGWKHLSTDILEILDSYDYSREDYWVERAWESCGVHPLVRAWCAAHKVVLPYPDGYCLNCQTSSIQHLWPRDGSVPPCHKKEVRDKVYEKIKDSFQEASRRYHESLTKEEASALAMKSVETKKKKYGYVPGYKEAVEAARSSEVRKKAAESRREYNRKHRSRYRFSDGFEGDYLEAAEHFNVNASSLYKWLHGRVFLKMKDITFSEIDKEF